MQDLFEEARNQIKYVVNRKVKSIVNDRIKGIDSRTFSEVFKCDENNVNAKYVNEVFEAVYKKADDIISRKDLTMILEFLDLKGLFFDIENKYVKNYKEKVLAVIEESEELRKSIKKNYIDY